MWHLHEPKTNTGDHCLTIPDDKPDLSGCGPENVWVMIDGRVLMTTQYDITDMRTIEVAPLANMAEVAIRWWKP
jgi:hypothetical protein